MALQCLCNLRYRIVVWYVYLHVHVVIRVAERELYYFYSESLAHLSYTYTNCVYHLFVSEDFIPVMRHEDHVFVVVLVADFPSRRFYISSRYTIYVVHYDGENIRLRQIRSHTAVEYGRTKK